MRWYHGVFCLSVLFAFLWNGFAFVGAGVREFYHPMAAYGDLLHPVRAWSVLVPLLVCLIVGVVWLYRRPLPKAVFLAGFCAVVLGAVLPLLPAVDNGYRQPYWLGDQRYAIPWQYGPFGGDTEPGGDYFLVRVSPVDLAPYYGRGTFDSVAVGKGIADHVWSGQDHEAGQVCVSEEPHFTCKWKAGFSSYYASGVSDDAPGDLSAFMADATVLLDNFVSPNAP